MASLKDRFARIAEGASSLGFDPLAREEVRLAELPLEKILPDPTQPRKDLGDLKGLQASIEQHGIMMPLIVSPNDEDTYLLVAGERRYTAAKALKLVTVPAIIRTIADHDRLQLQLIENLHRQDLSPIEEAQGYQRLMDEFGLTQRDVAKTVGKSLTSINETLRLLQLPEEITANVRTSEHATKSILLEIAKEPDPDRQIKLWHKAESGDLTVKKAREHKNARKTGDAPKPKETRQQIRTSAATVTIHFHDGIGTQEDIIKALREAIEEAEQLGDQAE